MFGKTELCIINSVDGGLLFLVVRVRVNNMNELS